MAWRDLLRRLFGPAGAAAQGQQPQESLATIHTGRDDPPPPLQWGFTLYLVTGQPGWEGVISWLKPADAARIGLPPEAAVAVVLKAKAPLDDANLRGSASFPPFLQGCMPALLEASPLLEAAAARFGDGEMAIPDGRGLQVWARNPRVFEAAPVLRIGTVAVRGGVIQPGTYQPNPGYRGFVPGHGAQGVAVVPPEFYPALLRRLEGVR